MLKVEKLKVASGFNGQWTMENGQRTMKMENGKRKMDNGQWKMENGRCPPSLVSGGFPARTSCPQTSARTSCLRASPPPPKPPNPPPAPQKSPFPPLPPKKNSKIFAPFKDTLYLCSVKRETHRGSAPANLTERGEDTTVPTGTKRVQTRTQKTGQQRHPHHPANEKHTNTTLNHEPLTMNP